MFINVIIFLLISMISGGAVRANPAQFDRMVVFGDSLSDNGKFFNTFGKILPKTPPYFQGHFTNGPVWPQMLVSTYFGDQHRLRDYAIGAAGAIWDNAMAPEPLQQQVKRFLASGFAERHTASALFVIWIGANNYLDPDFSEADSLTTRVVDAIETNALRLVDRGADKVVLINIPDLGKSPYGMSSHHNKELSEISAMHNQKLHERFVSLQGRYPNVHWVYIDADYFLTLIRQAPLAYGFTDVSQPCYDHSPFDGALDAHFLKQQPGSSSLLQTLSGMVSSNPVLKVALENSAFSASSDLYDDATHAEEHCQGHLFFDIVHPTTEAHRRIAGFMASSLAEAGIAPTPVH